MKIAKALFSILIFQAILTGAIFAEEAKNVLYQVSTIGALLGGILDGEVDYKTVMEHGDFGIGTFNALDGEMLALDGQFYQVKSDGSVAGVTADMKTPFCSVIFFKENKVLRLENGFVFKDLASKLDPLLPTANLIYGIRIDGTFDYVKTRSVPRQEKPYPQLIEVVKTQPTFEFHNVRGTVVGFRFPSYMQGVNVASYHFHFITEDRKGGGHILDWNLSAGVDVKVAEVFDFRMQLPTTPEFYQIDLSQDQKTDVVMVEQDKGHSPAKKAA